MWNPPVRRAAARCCWCTALACVLFLGALLVNARDEALTPEVHALLTPPPNPYGDQDNAYVALQGFDAPPAESVIAAGEARIEHYNRNIDAALRDSLAVSLEGLAAKDALHAGRKPRPDLAEGLTVKQLATGDQHVVPASELALWISTRS